MRGCSKPQRHGHKWRVVHPDEQGRRARSTFDSEREAQQFIDDFYAAASGAFGGSVAGAVDDYIKDRGAEGLKASTLKTLGYRLKALLRTDERERPLRTLTASVATALLKRRRDEASTDTLVGELVAAQGFSAWCVANRRLTANPFADLEVKGERARGKAQLRIDEARRFVAAALDEGSLGGLAAAMALLMGMRASEITGRQVRDVDDGGRVLWIDRAKTRKGDRHLEVPEVLRGPLIALCTKPDGRPRDGEDALFGDVDRHWVGRHVRRLCRVAKVPEVCPHGLRGTMASIAVQAVPAEHVAAALGQTGPAVTRRHYLSIGAEERGRGKAALKVLNGGKR